MTRTVVVGDVSALRGDGALEEFDRLRRPDEGNGRRRSGRSVAAEKREEKILTRRLRLLRLLPAHALIDRIAFVELLGAGRHGERRARRNDRERDCKPPPGECRHQSSSAAVSPDAFVNAPRSQAGAACGPINPSY